MADTPYNLVELSPEEGKKLTEELQAVLAKYDAEMGVTSQINLWKRVPKDVLSPIQPGQDSKPNEEGGFKTA